MKRLLCIALILLLWVAPANGAGFSLIVQCIDYNTLPPNYYIATVNSTNKVIVAYVEFIDQRGNALAFGEWLVDRQPGVKIWGGVALDVDSGVSLRALNTEGVQLASLLVDSANTAYAACSAFGWKPAAPSIAVKLVSDCQFIQIRDSYNNWHWVTSNGERVLLHYGEALIGNPQNGQSVNPDDYRAIATPCPG